MSLCSQCKPGLPCLFHTIERTAEKTVELSNTMDAAMKSALKTNKDLHQRLGREIETSAYLRNELKELQKWWSKQETEIRDLREKLFVERVEIGLHPISMRKDLRIRDLKAALKVADVALSKIDSGEPIGDMTEIDQRQTAATARVEIAEILAKSEKKLSRVGGGTNG